MPHLARSQILTGYAPLARSLGLSPERLAKSVGLQLSLLNDLDSRISAGAFTELLERSAKAARVEDFGLRLAQSRGLGILGPIGIVIHQEPDVRAALQSLIRYLPAHNESLVLRLEEEREVALLNLDVHLAGLAEARQVTELSLGAFFRIVGRLAGSQWKPHRICFEHSAPRNPAAHKRFFGCRVEFDQYCNAIVFPRGDLDAPLAMSDAMLARYAHRYLDSIMAHRSASASEKVRELVTLSLSSGSCSATKVARGLGVDRRTVHRYLQEAGKSFSSIVTEVRKELAIRLLISHRPMIEVASLLGFSGTPAFSRWFSQWFGCNPTRWRDMQERGAGTRAAPPRPSFHARSRGQ